jgi:hypothetical protein
MALTASGSKPSRSRFASAQACPEVSRVVTCNRILADLMPNRRIRTRPRVVKRAISKYNAKGTIDRTSYMATITILTSPTT